LINFVIDTAYELRQKYIGIEYIITCADPVVAPFYEKNEFVKMADYHELPREGWNVNCVPLVYKITGRLNINFIKGD